MKTVKELQYKDILASGVTEEKALEIADKLDKIAMLVNSIEVDLTGNEQMKVIFDADVKGFDLWSYIYKLEKKFTR